MALASLLVLVAIFVIGTVIPVNMGVVAFVATFLFGVLVAGIPLAQIFSFFPVNILVLLIGITYMFGVAQANGSMALLTQGALRLVRGRVAIIPWIFHAFAILFSALGAGPAASTAVLAPLALGAATTLRINPLLVGVMLVHGSHAGSMAPISVIGAIVNGTAAKSGLGNVSTPVFLNSLVFNIAIAAAAYLLLGGIGLIRRGKQDFDLQEPDPAQSDSDGATTTATTAVLGRQHVATFAGIALLLILTIGFKLDVGYTALTIGLALSLLSPKNDAKAVANIAWPTILLLGGIMTYIGVVTKLGGLDLVSKALLGLGSPVLAILLVAAVGAFISLFSATGAVIAAMIPLLVPLLGANHAIPVGGAVSTLAISTSVVDSSPLSLQGAVLIASIPQEERRGFFWRLMAWGGSMVVVGSVIAWFIFVVLPMWLA